MKYVCSYNIFVLNQFQNILILSLKVNIFFDFYEYLIIKMISLYFNFFTHIIIINYIIISEFLIYLCLNMVIFQYKLYNFNAK